MTCEYSIKHALRLLLAALVLCLGLVTIGFCGIVSQAHAYDSTSMTNGPGGASTSQATNDPSDDPGAGTQMVELYPDADFGSPRSVSADESLAAAPSENTSEGENAQNALYDTETPAQGVLAVEGTLDTKDPSKAAQAGSESVDSKDTTSENSNLPVDGTCAGNAGNNTIAGDFNDKDGNSDEDPFENSSSTTFDKAVEAEISLSGAETVSEVLAPTMTSSNAIIASSQDPPDSRVLAPPGDTLLEVQANENFSFKYDKGNPGPGIEPGGSMPNTYMVSALTDSEGGVTVLDCKYYCAQYKFIGWNTDPFGDGKWFYPGDKIFTSDGPFTYGLVAQWEPFTIEAVFTATEGGLLMAVGSTEGQRVTITLTIDPSNGLLRNANEEVISDIEAVPAQGYRFIRWIASGSIYDLSNTEATTNPMSDGIVRMLSWYQGEDEDQLIFHSLSFEAVFEANTYTISYDFNGGDGSMDPIEFHYGDLTPVTGVFEPSRSGYTFKGWYLKSDGNEVRVVNGSLINTLVSDGAFAKSNTATLVAQWEKNPVEDPKPSDNKQPAPADNPGSSSDNDNKQPAPANNSGSSSGGSSSNGGSSSYNNTYYSDPSDDSWNYSEESDSDFSIFDFFAFDPFVQTAEAAPIAEADTVTMVASDMGNQSVGPTKKIQTASGLDPMMIFLVCLIALLIILAIAAIASWAGSTAGKLYGARSNDKDDQK